MTGGRAARPGRRRALIIVPAATLTSSKIS
jgi:hypothetical protein